MTDDALPEGLVERCLGEVSRHRCPDFYADEGCDGLEGCADCMRLTLRAVLAVAAPQIREQSLREHAEIVRGLRVKLAEAGVEGSPPPGREATIPSLLSRARNAEAEASRLQAENHQLRFGVRP